MQDIRSQEIIFVVGGTGHQGGGVVQGLLKAAPKNVLIRTVSRPTKSGDQSPAAQALIRQGVEVIAGDLGDDETLCKALSGRVVGVFSNFDYWTLGAAKEIEMGKRVVDAAKKYCASTLRLFIFSGLEPMARLTDGRLKFEAFDSKTQVEDHLCASGLPWAIVKCSTYMEAFYEGYTKLTTDPKDGTVLFRYPLEGTSLTLVPVRDAGRLIARMLLDGSGAHVARNVGLAGDHITIEEMASIFEAVVGQKCRVEPVSIEQWERERGEGAANYWRFKKEFNHKMAQYMEQSRAIVPLISWREFLEQNKAHFDFLKQAGKKE